LAGAGLIGAGFRAIAANAVVNITAVPARIAARVAPFSLKRNAPMDFSFFVLAVLAPQPIDCRSFFKGNGFSCAGLFYL